jgi:molybdopterin converting factor small subunit
LAEQAMAQVKVNLYAALRGYVGGAPSVEVDVEPGEAVADVLARLGVPPEKTRILFVNNRAATLSQPLEDGDRVGVFPAIGGG